MEINVKLITRNIFLKSVIYELSYNFAAQSFFSYRLQVKRYSELKIVQWNLVIKRSDITKPSYNKVILLVLALCISLFFDPDIMRNLI